MTHTITSANYQGAVMLAVGLLMAVLFCWSVVSEHKRAQRDKQKRKRRRIMPGEGL
jgi:hypothetical protein